MDGIEERKLNLYGDIGYYVVLMRKLAILKVWMDWIQWKFSFFKNISIYSLIDNMLE